MLRYSCNYVSPLYQYLDGAWCSPALLNTIHFKLYCSTDNCHELNVYLLLHILDSGDAHDLGPHCFEVLALKEGGVHVAIGEFHIDLQLVSSSGS